jgi:hypothetical protein
MIIRIEGTANEIANFLGFMPLPQPEKAPKLKLSKAPKASRPYTGGKGDPTEKAEKAAKVKETKKPQKAPAKKSITITADEVRESGALECDSIPEAVEAIIELCKCNKASIARLLDVDNAAISSAANGKVYPYVERAFKQYLDFPSNYPEEA